MEYKMVDRFLLYKKNIYKIRESSIDTYRGIIIRFLNEANKNNLLNEIELYKSFDRFYLEDYINNKLEEGMSENYINSNLISIKDFFNYLFENEIINSNPFEKIKQIRQPQKKNIKEYFTIEEMRKLISETYNRRCGERCFEINSSRSRALISLLVNTGMRINEALALKETDLERHEDYYYIHIDSDKIKNHLDKNVIIYGKAFKFLNEYLDIKHNLFNTDWLFVSSKGKQFTAKNSIESLQKLVDKCELNKKITNHCTRATFRTTLLSKGVANDLIKIIGNWKLDSVSSAYVKGVDLETLKKVCNII